MPAFSVQQPNDTSYSLGFSVFNQVLTLFFLKAHTNPRQLQRFVRPPFATVWIVSSSNWSTTSLLELRSPDSTGYLFLLFSFQFSFFLWIKLSLFLMFSFAFIFFSLIAHIYFSLLENYLRRTVRYLSGCYQYYRLKSILFSAILRSRFISTRLQVFAKRLLAARLSSILVLKCYPKIRNTPKF